MMALDNSLRMLPTRIRIANGEALDGYLERLTTANGLRPWQMSRLLTDTDGALRPTLAFAMYKPDVELTTRISVLGAVSDDAVRNATLSRFDGGLPLVLDRLDPRQKNTARLVAGQSWFPARGTQVCPLCLALDGLWRVMWRLPIVTVCLRHGTFLTTRCLGCASRFRTLRGSPLRPYLANEHLCGNPRGRHDPCIHSVLDHVSVSAPVDVLTHAQTVSAALARGVVSVFDGRTDPQTYLAELRRLAAVLIILASQTNGHRLVDWANEVHAESAQLAAHNRRPRWSVRAPDSAVVRGYALAQAHQILCAPDVGAAAARLEPWLDLVPREDTVPSEWLLKRTGRTTMMKSLIRAATLRSHHVSRRTDGIADLRLGPSAIPQLFDEDLYEQFFQGMLGGRRPRARLYVSLCAVRAVTRVNDWADAATRIGLDPAVAVRLAYRRPLLVSADIFATAVQRAVAALPADRDFRNLEANVRALAIHPADWHETWRTSFAPPRRSSSLPFVITWMWCEVAQGCLERSPAWQWHCSSSAREAYRAFRARLPADSAGALRTLVSTYRPVSP